MFIWLRQYPIEGRLLAVFFPLFLLTAWIGQKFELTFFDKLSMPLFVFSACLFVWMFVRNMNLNRRIIGALINVILLTILFKNTALAHFLIVGVSYPLGILLVAELTRASKSDMKACLFWLLMAPLFGTVLLEKFVTEESWWLPLLAFPVTWIGMAAYADSAIYQRSLRIFSAVATLLFIGLIIAIDVLALDPVLELINDKEVVDILTKTLNSDGLPSIQLLVACVYLPFVAVGGISYYISKQKDA